MAAVAEKSRLAERAQVCLVARREAQQREKSLLTNPKNKTVIAALLNICFILLRMAQKYLPNTPRTFADYSDLARCARLLREMGFDPPVTAALAAHVGDNDAEVVTNSLEYRQLRNKSIACLATIADLTEKTTSGGSLDYQRGIREGYRRASDIALLFLKDFDAGDVL